MRKKEPSGLKSICNSLFFFHVFFSYIKQVAISEHIHAVNFHVHVHANDMLSVLNTGSMVLCFLMTPLFTESSGIS